MKKLLTILGTRPQIIKASAVSRAIRQHRDALREVIVHTGQHYDAPLSGNFFEELGVPAPLKNLEAGSGTHATQTARMLPGLEEILQEEKPDAVILYGDTNSTLAGALAASKLYIPILHIEAGLRSGDMNMPEEVNRICTDRVSTMLFAPTQSALENLRREGFPLEQSAPLNPDKPLALCSGDVMLDNQRFFREKLNAQPLRHLDAFGNDFILCTYHREKNTDNRENLWSISKALLEIASASHPVVIPMHPRTRLSYHTHSLEELLETMQQHPYIHIRPPLAYLDTLQLLESCSMVFTDSGGLQKEAFFLGKPSVIFREETEWTEIVEAGCAIPAACSLERIVEAHTQLKGRACPDAESLFGDGKAAEKICAAILSWL